MNFNQLFSPQTVCIEDGARSKTAVFYKVSVLINQINPNLDTAVLFDAYWQRERLGSTGVGHGVLVPHIRSSDTTYASACFIKLNHPVYFASLDKQPVDLVVGLVLPNDQNEENLLILKHLVEPLNQPLFRSRCRSAKNNPDLYRVIKEQYSPKKAIQPSLMMD